MASPMAWCRGAPRAARLATARSQRISVRKVEAAKTTAYCFRNDGLVKSTFVVVLIPSESFRTTHAAAVAHPFANDCNGSNVEVIGLVLFPVVPCCSHRVLALPKSPSQFGFALGL